MSKAYHGYHLSKLKAESQYTKFVFTGFIFKQICLNLLSIITKILSLLLHRFAIEDYFHKIYLGITTVTPIFNLPKSKTIITFIRNLFNSWITSHFNILCPILPNGFLQINQSHIFLATSICPHKSPFHFSLRSSSHATFLLTDLWSLWYNVQYKCTV